MFTKKKISIFKSPHIMQKQNSGSVLVLGPTRCKIDPKSILISFSKIYFQNMKGNRGYLQHDQMCKLV